MVAFVFDTMARAHCATADIRFPLFRRLFCVAFLNLFLRAAEVPSAWLESLAFQRRIPSRPATHKNPNSRVLTPIFPPAINNYLQGYDCLLTRTPLSADLFLAAKPLCPPPGLAPSAFALVSPTSQSSLQSQSPTQSSSTLLSRFGGADAVFFWAQPFEPAVWALIAASLVLSALLLLWLDDSEALTEAAGGGGGGDASAGGGGGAAARAARAAALALTPFLPEATHDTRRSNPGFRVFRTTYALCSILAVSVYVANAAAILGSRPVNSSFSTPPPSPSPSSFDDAAANGYPLCVSAEDGPAAAWARATLGAQTQIVAVNGSAADTLRAVLDPSVPCRAAVLPEAQARFYLGNIGDPRGVFCQVRWELRADESERTSGFLFCTFS